VGLLPSFYSPYARGSEGGRKGSGGKKGKGKELPTTIVLSTAQPPRAFMRRGGKKRREGGSQRVSFQPISPNERVRGRKRVPRRGGKR